MALALGAWQAQAGERDSGLPPIASGAAAATEAPLYLEVVVNRRAAGQVMRILERDGSLHATAGDLRRAGLPIEGDDTALLALDALPEVQHAYDRGALRLYLDTPADRLPVQHVGRDHLYARSPAHSSLGMLLNYDLHFSDPRQGTRTAAAWNELRLFGRHGILSTTGVYRHDELAGGSAARRGYLRYDTRWQHSDQDRMLTYEVGDLITRAPAWSSAVRLGGVQIARDFDVRPDVVTYPLPQFSGRAAVPTTVDLFINGQKADSQQLQPGPFTLTTLPYISGAGEAVVTTTDALGRQVSTTVPFYVSSQLLREGLLDYAFAAGALRRDYGYRDFGYGQAAATGSLRYGLNGLLTLEGHAEAADGLRLLGLGAVTRLNIFGILNVAHTRSRLAAASGGQTQVGYQYATPRYGIGLQRILRSRNYADLAMLEHPGLRPGRRQSNATFSLQGGVAGSIGLGYFDIEDGDGTRTRLANLSWSRPVWRGGLYLSANRSIEDGRWSADLQWLLPLGRRDALQAGIERRQDGRARQRASYRRNVPTEGGAGWNLGYLRDPDGADHRQADLAWRSRSLLARAGFYGDTERTTRWAGLSGSLVWMDRSLHAANGIHDGFVLVSTDGHAGVPVRYENLRIGSTDRGGHLLVPWSTAWYPARYEIDPLGLPAHLQPERVEQRLAVRAGSGYLLRFPIRSLNAASVTLHDGSGAQLPVGAVASTDDGRELPVGWDGIVYVEHLQPHNRLRVRLPEGRICTAEFAAPQSQASIVRIGPVTCRTHAESPPPPACDRNPEPLP